MRTKSQTTTVNLKKLFTAVLLLSGLLVFSQGPRLFAASAFESLSSNASPVFSGVPDPSAPAPFPGPLKAPPPLNAYFISVGEGDAEYIELPNGGNVLIDGGPNPTAPLAQFLLQHGVKRINHVVLTHPHLDHYAGLSFVFTNLKVDNFYDTREDNTGAAGAKILRDKISAMGVNTIYPSPGDSLNWDMPEVQVNVFNACAAPGGSNSGPVINNCSIVLKVTYQNTSLLFVGDMQSDQEANLVAKYGALLQSDVLKVGHHGSNTATSPAFLNAVKPKYAYIEVGKDNIFAFPAPVTLSNLQAVGATVFRTDLGGTQQFRIGGQ
jgi:competence protein ComEC